MKPAFVLDDPFHDIATKAGANFQIRKDLDFMITKSLLDVAERIPSITSTAPEVCNSQDRCEGL